jgi:hydrogenase expression/formation protein HypD
MKYIDEYRKPQDVQRLSQALKKITTRPWTLMEVCGGQTHAIVKFGLDELLPPTISLIHGPGCPVCVTPLEILEQSMHLAANKNIIFCSFGDMLRVPAGSKDLFQIKSEGGDIRIVYSPLDALQLAKENPSREVVFLAVGFETTAPACALAVAKAIADSVTNFSLLVSHVLVPPALEAILKSPRRTVQGFLAAGHVCSIMGTEEYIPISQTYRVPIVVTGFEPLDILHGVYQCVLQLEEGRYEVENAYTRIVQSEGNRRAQLLVTQFFEVITRSWRGLGPIPQSGLKLKQPYQWLDASVKFGLQSIQVQEPEECRSSEVLQGFLKPYQCPAFAQVCTPDHPLGAPMVSSEGACAAYYRYRLNPTLSEPPERNT